jgi:hypothetical protein
MFGSYITTTIWAHLRGSDLNRMTTPAGRAMAGLLAVFAEFERKILRERVHAALAHARLNGKRLGRRPSVVHKAIETRKLYQQGISKSRLHAPSTSAEHPYAASWSKRNPNLAALPEGHEIRASIPRSEHLAFSVYPVVRQYCIRSLWCKRESGKR